MHVPRKLCFFYCALYICTRAGSTIACSFMHWTILHPLRLVHNTTQESIASQCVNAKVCNSRANSRDLFLADSNIVERRSCRDRTCSILASGECCSERRGVFPTFHVLKATWHNVWTWRNGQRCLHLYTVNQALCIDHFLQLHSLVFQGKETSLQWTQQM